MTHPSILAGEKQDAEPWGPPIEPIERITVVPVQVGRADVWPPEVLEEIRRIYAGDAE